VHPVAHGDADKVHSRARRVPLLRAVRAGLPDRLGIHFEPGHDFSGDEDGQAADSSERDGARAHHRRLGKSLGDFLHRQDDRNRAAGALPHRGAHRERVRICARQRQSFAAALVLVVVFAPTAWKERMDPTRDEALDKSAESRLNAWTFAWNLACEYPVTGGGFKTFTRQLFARYAPDATDVKAPHSIYFGVLAEHGFVGLFLYLLLLISCHFSLRRIVRWATMLGDELTGNYARMLQFSMIGFMTSGFFLSRAYFDYYFTLVACVVVLKYLWRKRLMESPDFDEAAGEEEVPRARQMLESIRDKK
jgi:hypothetical protein